jgi:serine/threonine-protein kinase
MSAETAQKYVGTLLKEKWRLDRLLGVGGMAAVYAATHRNGKRVAVKILHGSLSSNQEVRSRFLREGYLANKVEHEGAVSVLDDEVTDDGSVFLVMDLLEGETLDARWQRKGRSLPANEVLGIADHLLDVLGAAHDKGIIHRDIKPENVFLTRSNAVKVLDFGIARLRESGPNETQVGTMMGTPCFMPPEQALGRTDEVDARTDVWAVGATMFTMLTGRYVHDGNTSNEVLLSAMTKQAPPILSLLPQLEPRVAQVIDCALAFDRTMRWPNARTMQAAVRSACEAAGPAWQPHLPTPSSPELPVYVGEVGAGSSGSSVLTTSRPSTQRSVPSRAPALLVGLGALLVVGAVGLAALFVSMRHRDAAPGAGLVTPTASGLPQSASALPSRDETTLLRPLDEPPRRDEEAPAPPVVERSKDRPPPVPRAAVASAARVTPAPSASNKAVSCNPPFEFDSNGVKRWKPGCL